MIIFGSIIFALGLMARIAGETMFLAVVYRRSLAWFFGCLFVPFVGWFFFALNAKQTWKPVVFSTAGFMVAGLGYWAGGLQFLHNGIP